jgi:hypothetical protein
MSGFKVETAASAEAVDASEGAGSVASREDVELRRLLQRVGRGSACVILKNIRLEVGE